MPLPPEKPPPPAHASIKTPLAKSSPLVEGRRFIQVVAFGRDLRSRQRGGSFGTSGPGRNPAPEREVRSFGRTAAGADCATTSSRQVIVCASATRLRERGR